MIVLTKKYPLMFQLYVAVPKQYIVREREMLSLSLSLGAGVVHLFGMGELLGVKVGVSLQAFPHSLLHLLVQDVNQTMADLSLVHNGCSDQGNDFFWTRKVSAHLRL